MAAPPPDDRPEEAHEERVHGAFGDLESRLGDRPDAAVREKHGWLWEEMTRHSRVASLIDELALQGF